MQYERDRFDRSACASDGSGKLKPGDFPGVCPPQNYGFLLNTLDSDVAAVETVIEWIHEWPGAETAQVALVGYSAGAMTLVPFMLKDENWKGVSSLFLCSPMFPPDMPDDPFPNQPKPRVIPPLGSSLNVWNKADQFGDWDRENPVGGGQRRDEIADVAWDAMMILEDKLTAVRQWGTDSKGLLRWPGLHPRWGFNEAFLKEKNHDATSTGIIGKKVPVLILYGVKDSIVTKPAAGLAPAFSVERLIRSLDAERNVAVRVEGSGHYIPWEKHRKELHKICQDWLDSGGKIHALEKIDPQAGEGSLGDVAHAVEQIVEDQSGRFYVQEDGTIRTDYEFYQSPARQRYIPEWLHRTHWFWLGAAGTAVLAAVVLRSRRVHPEFELARNAHRLDDLQDGVSSVAIERIKKLAHDLHLPQRLQ